jgi:iron complex outermembrane recepter protein
MRRVSALLWSSTAIAAAFAISSPAFAQDVPPPNPDETAQTSPAQSGAGAPQNGETIVVTGLRRSLQSARNIKRNSDQIVDAVVAEDIGKLPDITVSDTAARIPGIQVERNGGEASRVLLRGLDRNFYTTTYDSREIFTAETRSVALQDFPAGAVSAVEAFKTSTADLVEPGLSGLINVRSRRPFDFKGFEVAGSVWGVWGNQARDFKPQGQLLLSDRWNVGGGEFGALINFSYTRLHYQDSIRRHGFFIADLAGFRSPDFPEIRYAEGDRWRPSVNGSLQYRNGNLELYADGLWQGYRENVHDRLWQQPLWNCGQATYSNLVVEDGRIISGTVNRPGCNGDWPQGFQGATKRRTNTYQFAVGGRYDAGPLRISADLARTSSTFKLFTESVDYKINTNNLTVDWFTGHPGGSGPTFEVTGIDFTDPSIYNYRGFFEDYLTAKGQDWQGRLDFEFQPTGLAFLPKIQWGFRYVDRDASRRAGARYFNANDGGRFNIPISAVPLDYELFSPAFHGDSHAPTPTTWLAPTFDSVWDNLVELRQFNLDHGVPCDGDPVIVNCDTNAPNPDPRRNFDINEKSPAAYAQLNYSFDVGGANIGGILGMRWVRTKDRISGTFFSDQPNPLPTLIEPISVTNSYSDWLPNANMNIRFSPQWTLRLAVTKTRTRPLFEQLNPSLELDAPNTSCNPALTHCARTGRGGNPFLEPLRSTNYDASLEYYFSRTGFASAAVFMRDMKGFIVNRTVTFPDPDPDTGFPLEISGPVNTNKGKIKGFEAQVSTFFDWDWVPLWARAFGAQANVTYINAKTDLPLFCPAFLNPCVSTPPFDPNAIVRREPIPDVSKWTWNLVGMYERGPLSVRLSYNRRSSYPEGGLDQRREGPGNNPINYTLQGRGNPVSRLDLSTTYNVSDNLTLFFDWTNMLKKPFQSDIVRVNYAGGEPTSTEIFPMVVRYEESVLSGGIRFRFGGSKPAAAAAPVYVPPPAPPPVAAPPPVEQPAPPPPPPASAPERG